MKIPIYLSGLILIAFAYSTLAGTTDGNQEGQTSTTRSSLRAIAAQNENADFLSILKSVGFSLGKSSSSVEEEGLPAEVGFIAEKGKATDYHADFFLKWVVPYTKTIGDVLVSPEASVEGHLLSSDTTVGNAWRFRIGTEVDSPIGGGKPYTNPVTGHEIDAPSENWIHLELNAKYEANRDFKLSKIMGEIEITPDIPSLFIGQTAYHYFVDRGIINQPGSAPWMDFRWRPFLDFDLGETLQREASVPEAETKDAIVRIRPKIHADVWLNGISRLVQIHTLRAYCEYEFTYLPLEDSDDAHHFVETGLVLGFTKNVGFTISYSVGEQAPALQHEDKVTGAISFGF